MTHHTDIRSTAPKPQCTALGLSLAVTIAALAACASVPQNSATLDQARSQVAAAQADPQVVSMAPEELRRAADALRTAEKAWRDGEKPATVDHLAYLTAQRAKIAQDTASSASSQAVTAGAAAERDKLILASRTAEADAAKQRLAMEQQRNAQKTAELAAAQTAAMQAQQDAANRDAKVNDLQAQLQDLNAKKTDRGMVVTLGDVLFDTGKATLLAGSTAKMAKIAEFLNKNPDRTASIEGHTDSTGSAALNLDLSARRAQAVQSALVGLGVQAQRLTTQARGADTPVAPNTTAAGRQLNRRVEIIFSSLPGDSAQ